jgi:5-methylcytosine-specific restriction endonuclease McrA
MKSWWCADHIEVRDKIRVYRRQGKMPPFDLTRRWKEIQSEEAVLSHRHRRVDKLKRRAKKARRKAALQPITKLRALERQVVPQVARLARAVRGTLNDPKYGEFYESVEWRKLRYLTMLRYKPICMCCGAHPPTALNVDHIVPVRVDWDRRLDPENLQILCADCNAGKGNRDETDFRRPEFEAT